MQIDGFVAWAAEPDYQALRTRELTLKTKLLLFMACLLLTGVQLYSVNQMEIIQTMAGEYIGAEFGSSIVSMDFNGDGYDDLIVKSARWNPFGTDSLNNLYGKLYFYWGGPNFDNSPDFVIVGQYPKHLGGETYSGREGMMINAGDVNGDGIDDLVIPQKTDDHKPYVAIYFGRAIPQTVPDIVLEFQGQNVWQVDVFPLGDINGDGKCDISLSLIDFVATSPKVLIWTDVFSEPMISYNLSGNLDGVGDVNDDGFADMLMFYLTGPSYSIRNFTFFYGDESCTMADSLYIGSSEVATDPYSTSVGDVNGDGYNDFVTWSRKVWFGGDTINQNPNVTLVLSPMLSFSYGAKPSLVFGDINGDGYDDIIGADNHTNGDSGQGGVWLGGLYMNETRDIVLNPPSNYQYRNFGWSKAAGDFNADGYCDIAFSAPIWTSGHTWDTEGKVFVFAGNPNLTDTTVANEDEYMPALNDSDWQIKVYPNPSAKGGGIQRISFVGDAYLKSTNSITLDIYNIKGQKVISKAIPAGEYRSEGIDLDLSAYPAGIYLLNIIEGIQTRTETKITIY
jgi:hypothetical protein